MDYSIWNGTHEQNYPTGLGGSSAVLGDRLSASVAANNAYRNGYCNVYRDVHCYGYCNANCNPSDTHARDSSPSDLWG